MAGMILSAGLMLMPFPAETITRPPAFDGWWSHYAKGVSIAQREYAIEYHGLPPDWGGIMIALLDCDNVGDVVDINLGDGWQPAFVVDCGGPDVDYNLWVDNDILGEVLWPAADEYDMTGNGLYPGKLRYRNNATA